MSGLDLQVCTAGRWHGAMPAVLTGISSDTRRIKPGDAFVALRGPNFDGHAFAAEALGRGAVALIGDAAGMASWAELDVPRLEVGDSLQALGHIAGQWRATLGLPVVAVTGSYGKTTLRSMLEHILAFKGLRVTATRSNDNNLIGVPQTLLRMTADDDAAIVECGISEPGEMHRLAAMVKPDVAVITGISAAHGEGLGGLSGVAAEKAILFEGLKKNGCMVLGEGVSALLGGRLPQDSARLLDMGDADEAVQYSLHGLNVNLHRGDQHSSFNLSLPARHWAQDAALAASILDVMGLATLSEVGEAMADWQAVGGRMQRMNGAGGCTLLDDSYNANPASMAAALNTLRSLTGRRIAVLGDMAELGSESAALHAGLDITGLDGVLLVGGNMRALADIHPHAVHVADAQQAVPVLKGMQPGRGDTLLIKGSRCMHMEQVVNALREVGNAV